MSARVLKGGASADGKSVFVASWLNDPATNTGANNVVAFAMGSELPGGRKAPPFHMVGFGAGTQLKAGDVDPASLLGARSAVGAKGFISVVHYAIGEFCDVDGVPGYQGAWPPKFLQIQGDLVVALASGTMLKNDTFVAAATWSDTTFTSVTKSTTPPSASLSSASDKGGVPLYTLDCHVGNSSATVRGLTLGDYRFKCDVTLNPGPYRIDHAFPGGATPANEAKATSIGCSTANRKMAMLAFIAGAAVDSQAAPAAAANWHGIKVGAAKYEFLDQVDIAYPNGTVLQSANVVFQVLDVATIFPEKSMLPGWIADVKAVLVTFDVGRDVMSDDTLQLVWDPSLGFDTDPSTVDTGSSAADAPAATPAKKSDAVSTHWLSTAIVAVVVLLLASM